jgi:hypothetical protein
MAKFKFYGMREADAEIKSADAAINPLLSAANITTIDVAGKKLPATSDEVPLDLKITALAATHKVSNGDEQLNQTLANNNILAVQAKDLSVQLASAETSVSVLTGEKSDLEARNKVLNDSVRTLTAENAEMKNLRATAVEEGARLTGQITGLNSEISRQALKFGCLTDLKDKEGNLLTSKATAAEREAAADLIPAKDKLMALGGAATAALQRLGVPSASTPATPPTGSATQTPKMSRADFLKLGAKEQTAFLALKGQLTDN